MDWNLEVFWANPHHVCQGCNKTTIDAFTTSVYNLKYMKVEDKAYKSLISSILLFKQQINKNCR